MTNQITNIIVHCSDSDWGCCRAIRNWHIVRGWRDIGYHFIILNGFITCNDFQNKNRFNELNGQIECGRYLDGNLFMDDNEIGAQCLGYNRNSIGICYVGKKATESQQIAITTFCAALVKRYKLTYKDVLGHCETESGKEQGKTCPNLNMDNIRNSIKNILSVE